MNMNKHKLNKMILNKEQEEASHIRNMIKTINEHKHGDKKILSEENEIPTSDTSGTQIPINDSTFPGILKDEQEKVSQKLSDVEFEENPLMFNPDNNTVSFTGVIRNMNNLRWYFTSDTSTPDGGCFIFVEGLQLNDKTIQILHVIQAHYEAWVKEWSNTEIERKLNINPEQVSDLQQKYANAKYFNV